MPDTDLDDFLSEDLPPTRYSIALDAYYDKFGTEGFSTAGIAMSEDKWIEVLNECVEKGIRFDEYMRLGNAEPGDLI